MVFQQENLLLFWMCIRDRFKEGPVMLILIDLDPPTDLPKSDACCANALAPG